MHETGVDCMKMDLRHIGDEAIKEKLGGIREISIKFSGIDPFKGDARHTTRMPLYDGWNTYRH